jgi:glycosyltransferase involved in cell wall biosynthesis
MRILIDAREARKVISGLGRYALNLVRHLALIDRENEYIVLRHPSYPEPLVVQENFREIVIPFGISTVRNILFGASRINSIQADIYHALFHFLPMGVHAKRVVTLHDLIWVDHSDIAYSSHLRQWWVRQFGAPFIRQALLAADHVIAISECTRKAALSRYSLPEEKFSMIHHGIDPLFSAVDSCGSRSTVREGRRFIFSLGHTKPYKNIPRLIQAFAKIAPLYPDLFLMIVGRGDEYPSLLQMTHEVGLQERVLFKHQMSDEEVRTCFQEALFFAFPSLVEGFGFPVVEAMASGCPVLTSRESSMGEIVGNAAILVDPYEVDSIVQGMQRLIEDASLRQALSDKGRNRAGCFTWQTCAEKTLTVYQRLIPNSSNA